MWVVRMSVCLILLTVAPALLAPARGQSPSSSCLAIAEAVPGIRYVSLTEMPLAEGDVRLTFAGHATFIIESSGGVRIATDYAGYLPAGVFPDIATMNRAHRSHYTDNPSPEIAHVLRGWGTIDEPARHHLEVGDVLLRNVTTDTRDWSGGRIPDGNSIFIVEVGGLCIGHLGHLHHDLGPDRIAQIGRLDVVLVPVDGSFTMAQPEMVKVLKNLRTQLVIPMHYFSPETLNRFLMQMREDFSIEISPSATTIVSLKTLPKEPTVRVLPGY